MKVCPKCLGTMIPAASDVCSPCLKVDDDSEVRERLKEEGVLASNGRIIGDTRPKNPKPRTGKRKPDPEERVTQEDLSLVVRTVPSPCSRRQAMEHKPSSYLKNEWDAAVKVAQERGLVEWTQNIGAATKTRA